MRTTVTLTEETKQALQALAQERGLKGFSPILEEAVRFYLAERNKPAVVAEPVRGEVVGGGERPGADVGLRSNPGAVGFAIHSVPLWAGLLGIIGLIAWHDFMRLALLRRG